VFVESPPDKRPFTTSLTVPSPPKAMTVLAPDSTASRASAAACPRALVVTSSRSKVASNARSATRREPGVLRPAFGFSMRTAFIVYVSATLATGAELIRVPGAAPTVSELPHGPFPRRPTMEAMDARRLKLYELLKPKLDEEPARELVLALPSEPDRLVTKDYLDVKLSEQESRIVDKLTWRMITVMGAWTVAATSLFALMSQLVQP
jgi:hypothetical protein